MKNLFYILLFSSLIVSCGDNASDDAAASANAEETKAGKQNYVHTTLESVKSIPVKSLPHLEVKSVLNEMKSTISLLQKKLPMPSPRQLKWMTVALSTNSMCGQPIHFN